MGFVAHPKKKTSEQNEKEWNHEQKIISNVIIT